ncbi:hypothetical protein ECDEC7B_5045, partial [Escherichia coli DEC7B]
MYCWSLTRLNGNGAAVFLSSVAAASTVAGFPARDAAVPSAHAY